MDIFKLQISSMSSGEIIYSGTNLYSIFFAGKILISWE